MKSVKEMSTEEYSRARREIARDDKKPAPAEHGKPVKEMTKEEYAAARKSAVR